MKLGYFALAAFAVILIGMPAGVRAASPSPAPIVSAAPSATPDPAITARAKEWLHRLETADIDRSQLTSQMSDFLTPDRAKQLATRIGVLGDPTSFVFVSKQTTGDFVLYTYRATFKTTVLNEVFALDNSGKIGGLRLAAPT